MIKFSKQAEDMINKLENKEKAKERLIELAKQREIIITGSDVIRYLIKNDLKNQQGDI